MADAPIRHHEELYINKGVFTYGEPKVKYRGIFINDEWPSFGTWCSKQFGGINSKAYSHIFELLLRLKANYFWPAMWASRFNEDDTLSPKMADDMGTGNDAENMKTLSKVIDSQRRIISNVYGKSAADIPQLWAIFTEVQRYYDAGFNVPDDVTLLFCDNNWGYIRRKGRDHERKRKGGLGLYYHIDMNG